MSSASGLSKHGNDSEKPLPYVHYDIAPSACEGMIPMRKSSGNRAPALKSANNSNSSPQFSFPSTLFGYSFEPRESSTASSSTNASSVFRFPNDLPEDPISPLTSIRSSIDHPSVAPTFSTDFIRSLSQQALCFYSVRYLWIMNFA